MSGPRFITGSMLNVWYEPGFKRRDSKLEFIIGWLRYFKKSRGLPIYLSARFMILCHTVISAAYYLLSPVTDIKKIEDKRKALKLCWEMLLERSFFQA